MSDGRIGPRVFTPPPQVVPKGVALEGGLGKVRAETSLPALGLDGPELPPVAEGDSTTATPVMPPAEQNAAAAAAFAPLVNQVLHGPEVPDIQPMEPGAVNPEALQEGSLNLGEIFKELSRQLPVAVKDPQSSAAQLMQTGLPMPHAPSVQAVVAQLQQNPTFMASVQQSMPGARAARGEIEIPSGPMVQIEGDPNLAGMDIETAVTLVLFAAAKDSENDLRSMMQQVQDTNNKKAALRQQISAVHQQQSDMEGQIRQEYKARQQLDPSDPNYVPPNITFEQYESQRGVDFPLNQDGVYDGQPATLSGDLPMFNNPSTGATTGSDPSTLNVAPAVYKELEERYQSDPSLRAQFGSFESFLTSPNGVGLDPDSKATQTDRALKWLMEHPAPPPRPPPLVVRGRHPISDPGPGDTPGGPSNRDGSGAGGGPLDVHGEHHANAGVSDIGQAAAPPPSVAQHGTFADFSNMSESAQNALDSQSDLAETQQMKLQMYMDRMQKMYDLISNNEKKDQDTAMNTIGNMK